MMTETASAAARGTSAFLGQAAVTGFLRVLNLAILTRLLLQEEMGQIAFLGIIYGFMQFLGALGLNHAAPLVVPAWEARGGLDKVKSFLRRSVYIILMSSSGMVVLVFLLSPVLSVASGVSPGLIQIALVIVPFSALETFLDSFLLARYSVRRLASGRILFDIARITGTVGLVLAGMGVAGVMMGWFVSEIVAVVVLGASAFRKLDISSTAIDMKPILAFAIPSLVFQTIDVTIQNTDRLILLHLTDLATLGVFDVLLRVLYMLSLVSLTIAGSVYPILTRIRVELQKRENEQGVAMGRVIVKMVRYILIVILPVAVVISLNAYVALEVLFGTSYAAFTNAVLSFSILIVSYALWGVVYSVHAALRSMGEARFFVAVGLGVIAFEVVGCWYLTLWLGLLGSAMVRSMYVILLFLSSWGRLRQVGIKGLGAVGISVAKIGIASLIAGVFVFYIAPVGFIDLAAWLIASAALYLLLLFAFREVNALDFRMARALLPRRLHGAVDRLERAYIGES